MNLSLASTRDSIRQHLKPLRRVRPRTPFWKISAHRVPTLQLYKRLLKHAPTDAVRFASFTIFFLYLPIFFSGRPDSISGTNAVEGEPFSDKRRTHATCSSPGLPRLRCPNLVSSSLPAHVLSFSVPRDVSARKSRRCTFATYSHALFSPD